MYVRDFKVTVTLYEGTVPEAMPECPWAPS